MLTIDDQGLFPYVLRRLYDYSATSDDGTTT